MMKINYAMAKFFIDRPLTGYRRCDRLLPVEHSDE
jgi:hypothetical protein